MTLLRLADRGFPTESVRVDGRQYSLQMLRKKAQPAEVPRLVVVAYQPNIAACDIVRVCVQAIQRYTPVPHELWVIDNCSPKENVAWLIEQPDINVALNRTWPLPPEGRTILGRWRSRKGLNTWGSYGNAVGLELAVRLIHPETRYLMTLHMDTMPCHIDWLPFLQSKLSDRIRAAGVRMDRARTPEGVLHVLGYLVDYQTFRHLGLDFWPQMPQFDVGDRVTVALRDNGFDVYACRNTLWEPELAERISPDSPFRSFQVDRSFDDEANVIFLHLGRGVTKSIGLPRRGETPEKWIQFAETHLLSAGSSHNCSTLTGVK